MKQHEWSKSKSEVTDLVDRQIAAYQARDIDAFLTFYDKDVRIRQFDGSVMVSGLDGMRGFYEPLFRDSPQLNARILHRIAAVTTSSTRKT